MTTYETVRQNALKLPSHERQLLYDELIASRDIDPVHFVVTPEWNDEISQRIDDIKSGQEIGIPLENVIAELREKYP